MRVPRALSIAVVVLLLIVASASSAADAPKSFRGIKWSSSPGGGLIILSGPTDGVTIYAPTSKKLPPFFDLPVTEEAYMYSRGRFYSGSVWLDGQDLFEKMKAELTKAYGQPSFKSEQMYLWKWKWSRTKIEVHLSYQPKYSRTSVTFVNNGI
jgi:hypothetical protein